MPSGTWPVSPARWVCLLFVFCLTAELVSRIDDALTWGAPLLHPYTHDRLLLQDSLGFRGHPNYRYQKWRMNNLGFRGPDLSTKASPGIVRVAFLGASETFGLYESEGREYPARTQAILDSIAPGRFAVVNAGLPGMSLAAMVPYFRRQILPVAPQVLFVYPSPSFYLEIKPPPLEYTPPLFQPAPPVSLGPWHADRELFASRMLDKSKDVVKELVPQSVITWARDWQLRRVRSAHGADWIWQSVPSDRMAIFRVQLERLVTEVQATGTKVVLMTHTNRFTGAAQDTAGPDRRHLVNVLSAYWPRATFGVLLTVDSVANGIIRDVAAAHHAEVLELEGRVPPTRKDFADYVHFTDSGADVVARIVAGDLTAPPPPPRR